MLLLGSSKTSFKLDTLCFQLAVENAAASVPALLLRMWDAGRLMLAGVLKTPQGTEQLYITVVTNNHNAFIVLQLGQYII